MVTWCLNTIFDASSPCILNICRNDIIRGDWDLLKDLPSYLPASITEDMFDSIDAMG